MSIKSYRRVRARACVCVSARERNMNRLSFVRLNQAFIIYHHLRSNFSSFSISFLDFLSY